jgi:heparan-alpha-glucosaminide N-acetyltransferase
MSADLAPSSPRPPRVLSIDAFRGIIMFAMIVVNDIAPAEHLPSWIQHYSKAKPGGGLTFVDLVFPAFLFIVGMSIPFALGGRLARGEPVWKLLPHILIRTFSLLLIGVMMVNAASGPATARTLISHRHWIALLYVGAILSFCTLAPPGKGGAPSRRLRWINLALRALGFGILIFLALIYRARTGERIIAFHDHWPIVSIRTQWYGILGMIGWAYLVGSLVYLLFRQNRLPLLASMALLLCLFAADRRGAFHGWWLSSVVKIGTALGAQPSVTVAGILLATILLTPETADPRRRVTFTLLFMVGCAGAAALLRPVWGISKSDATPPWCLWACVASAAAWLVLYLVMDVGRVAWLFKPATVAGENVLLAYLLSTAVEPWLSVLHVDKAYDHFADISFPHALFRSTACAVVILALTALLNRIGFRLKL